MANEKRLIDANALKEYLNSLEASGGHKYYRKGVDDTLHVHIPNIVDEQSTVDAVEVVHGRWQPHYEIFDADPAVGILGGNYQTGWQCSVCGRYESIQEPYCNCGAKMDGDGNG